MFPVSYLKTRSNLIEHHLKVPNVLLKNSKVLCLSRPSKGSLDHLIDSGCKVTFLVSSEAETKAIETEINMKKSETFHSEFIKESWENYDLNKKYQMVLAEGFLHFQEDPIKGYKKVLDFLDTDGLLISSVISAPGTFLEFFKKFFQNFTSTKVKGVEELEIAICLFDEAYGNTNHSKQFTEWLEATIFNPKYSSNSFIDYIKLFNGLPLKTTPYSCWPNHWNYDDLVWHKNPLSNEDLNKATINGYLQRYHLFIAAQPTPGINKSLVTPEVGQEIRNDYLNLIEVMDQYINSEERDENLVLESLSVLVAKTERYKACSEINALFKSCYRLLQMLSNETKLSEFENAWKSFPEISEAWGTPGHYYTFIKK